MDRDAPLISILIPVFNRPELIAECLESVIAQTYSNWECIVVDDGSSDDTYDVVKQYTKDSRVKAFKREHEPKGAPGCREMGRKISKGQYLIFLDSDDLLAPWALSERIQCFLSNPQLDVLLSNGLQFSSVKKKLIDYTALYNKNQVLELFLQMQVVFQTTSPTWKSAFIEKNNIGWDVQLPCWQDVDFAIQAFSHNPTFLWASVLPDYFLRKDEDPFALTSRTNIIQKIVSNFYTYEKWLKNEKNRPVLEKHFPDYMLGKLEYSLSKKDLELMLGNHYSLIKKHLGKTAVSYLKLYNKTRNIRTIKGPVYHARPYLTNIKRKSVVKREFQFNETVKVELLNKLKEFDSDLFKNYENA